MSTYSNEIDADGIEFSTEVVLVTGYLYYLKHTNNLPKNFIVKTFKGCEIFYYFLDDKHIIANYDKRSLSKYKNQEQFINFYDKNKHLFIFPPYKLHFKNNLFIYEKPLFVIYNKYHSEINQQPINYISKDLLASIIRLLSKKYQIIYEHVSTNVLNINNFSLDWNNTSQSNRYVSTMNDFTSSIMHTIKTEFKEVIIFDDLVSNESYNLTKCKLYSCCDNFISVSFGNTSLINLFAKKLLIYLSKNPNYTRQKNYYLDRYKTINKEGDIRLIDDNTEFLNTLKDMFL